MSVDSAILQSMSRTATPANQVASTINNVLVALSNGDTFYAQTQKGGTATYGPCWSAIRNTISSNYSDLFSTKPGRGRELFIDPSDVAKIDANAVLAAVMGADNAISFKVVKKTPTTVEESVTEEAVPYSKQLAAVRSAVKLLKAGATNAIFLGGRGGVGKTQQVEEVLASFGLEDGCGYHKIAGSASAAGVYRTLWENRDGIVFFDDSDKALTEMEARNYFKSAADTKKVRKVCAAKNGKSYVALEDINMTDDGEVDDDRLPRSFEFTGKVIFISNLGIDKLDPDGALRTRGWVQSVNPTNEEVYDYMEEICDKIVLDVNYRLTHEERMEVIEILRSRKVQANTVNLRQLVKGLNYRAGISQQGGSDEEWKELVRLYA